MLTLAYSRKLADPPAAQRPRFIHAFPCMYGYLYFSIHQHFVLFFILFFFPPVSFLPSLRVLSASSSIFIHYYFWVPKKWGVQREKVFFFKLRSLLFSFLHLHPMWMTGSRSYGRIVCLKKMWKSRVVIFKKMNSVLLFSIPPWWCMEYAQLLARRQISVVYSSCHFIKRGRIL